MTGLTKRYIGLNGGYPGSVRAILLGLVVLLFVLTGASSAFAQSSGTILGVVKDSSGGVVPGVTVTVRNTENNQTRTATTADDGAYRIPTVPVGPYTVSFEKAGFETRTTTGLVLEVAQELSVNADLTVGTSQQEVTVTAEAPLVNTTTASSGGLVNEQKIVELPLNGRNYLDLTLLQPGVTQQAYANAAQPGEGGMLFSSNGAPWRSNDYLLDGTMLQFGPGGNGGSVIGNSLGVDGIREYRVITNNFPAEYGMTMGSQMVLVSKGGSNQFHGDVFDFLRNSALDARNFFDLRPSSPDLNGHRLPEFRRNNYGGSLGGPIRKDKTFFFGVFEAVASLTGTTNTVTTLNAGCEGFAAGQQIWNGAGAPPTGSVGNCPQLGGTTATATTISPVTQPFYALYPAPTPGLGNSYGFVYNEPQHEDYGQMRIDQTISPNDTLFGRFTFDQANLRGPLNFPVFEQGLYSRSQYVTVSEAHVISTTMLNSARFSYSRTNLQSNSSTSLTGSQYVFVPGLPAGIGDRQDPNIKMGTVGVSGLQGLGPSGTAPKTNLQGIFAFSDDLSYTRGKHALKFGAVVNAYDLYIYTHGVDRGGASFSSIAAFIANTSQTFTSILPTPLLVRDYHWWVMGFYGQDDWRVTPRLTLNLGLRYEPATTYNEINGHASAVRNLLTDTNTTVGPPFRDPSYRDISPRVGLAWDVFGDGKTAVRAGFAELYDVAEYGSQMSFSGASMPPFEYTVIIPGQPLTVPYQFPNITQLGTSAFPLIFRGMTWLERQPHDLQYNLAIERQLPGGLAVTLGYEGSRGMNLPMYNEDNPTIPNGVPQTAGGVESCVAPTAGTAVNLGSQIDGVATSCFLTTATRRNPAFGTMIGDPNAADSFYNGLSIQVNKRLTHGLQFQSSYTYAKLIDDMQAATGSDSFAPHNSTDQDALHYRTARAPADFDITHNWQFNMIYHLPKFSFSNGFEDTLLNGWWTSGILALQTGYAMSPYVTANRSQSVVGNGSGIDRPDLAPGRREQDITHGVSTSNGVNPCPTAGQQLGTPNLWFDPCAFTEQPLGFLGNAQRNEIWGPGLFNTNFSLVKDTAMKFLGESGSLQFRTELFNALNHPNFALPSTGVVYGGSGSAINGSPNGNAGQILRQIGNPRNIQFALKLIF